MISTDCAKSRGDIRPLFFVFDDFHVPRTSKKTAQIQEKKKMYTVSLHDFFISLLGTLVERNQ